MEVKLSHSLKNPVSLFSVGRRIREGNEEVIHIDDKPSFSNHVSEGIVHELLKRHRGVAETEEHHGWFEESFVGDESGFPLMTVFDADVVVSRANIKLGKVVSIFQLVHEVGDEGKRVGVVDSMFIEVTVVLTGTELEGQTFLVAKFSSRKSLVAFFLSGESR